MRIGNGSYDLMQIKLTQNNNRSRTEAVKSEKSLPVKTQKVATTDGGNPQEKTKEQEVIKVIEKANKVFKTIDRRLEISIHDLTKEIMVKVIDTETDTVIREIPSEKVLDRVFYLRVMAGIFIDEKR